MQKIDTIAADDTGTIKLILWEQLIDSVHTGLSYHFKNHTIILYYYHTTNFPFSSESNKQGAQICHYFFEACNQNSWCFQNLLLF